MKTLTEIDRFQKYMQKQLQLAAKLYAQKPGPETAATLLVAADVYADAKRKAVEVKQNLMYSDPVIR
jgi:hypothetical protein